MRYLIFTVSALILVSCASQPLTYEQQQQRAAALMYLSGYAGSMYQQPQQQSQPRQQNCWAERQYDGSVYVRCQ